MNQPVRILYVDDYPLDRELVRDALEKEHGGFEVTEAASRTDFQALLAKENFDLVLSDFNILGFEGLQVLEAVHAKDPHLPVIIVTGTGSEEVAAEAIKRGAADYVIKTPKHIQHLPHMIRAVLEKQQLEYERQQAENKLRESEDKFKYVFDHSVAGKSFTLPSGELNVNQAFCDMVGYSVEELDQRKWQEITHPEDLELTRTVNQAMLSGEKVSMRYTMRFVHKNGSIVWADVAISLRRDGEGKPLYFMSTFLDITAHKQAEAKIQRQLEHLTALSGIDRIISANFDLRLSLSEILINVIKELGVDAADILILNSNLQMLEYVAGHGFRTRLVKNAQVRLGEIYAGRVALERKLLHLSNLGDEPVTSKLASFLKNEDFVCYFGVPLIAKGQVKGVLEVYQRSDFEPDPEWYDFLNTLAGQSAIAIENSTLFESLQRSNSELVLAYDATIEGWSHALDFRDKETEGHTLRVTEQTGKLARQFGLSETDLVQVRWGALLHDIGKMGVPDGILLKPGPLTDEEWVLMKKHPGLAYELLAPIHYLHRALDIPYCHHEKWDGTGYPRALKGELIPLAARIFAVVDVWDALTSDRPYRLAWSKEKTRQHIQDGAGTHFDPRVVETFLTKPR